MFNFFKRNFYIPLLLIISFIVYHTWFFTFGIIKSGDWGYFYKETMATLNIHWFSLWMGDVYGRVLFDIGQAPTYALYGYLAKYLNFDFILSERIIYLWSVALLTPLFSYLLLRKALLFDKTASFVGAIFYSFNTYFLVLQTGHMTLMGAFSLAPIVVLLYIKTMAKLTVSGALIAGLLLSLAFAYEPRATYVIVWVLFFYAIFHLFFIKKNESKKDVLKSYVIAALPVIVLGLLNFYWVIGLLNTRANGIDAILGRSLFGDGFYNILYSFTLYHPFWTGSEIAVFNPQPIPLYFWIIPLFAILGLILNKKNRYVLFFGFISLLGIFLSKQVGYPFAYIYPWLYTHFPGFSAFREASKFYFLIALGYSVLIAGFVDWLWKNWDKNKLQIYGKYLLTFAMVSLFLWNTKPLITGEYKTLFIARKINNDYLIVKDFINHQDEYFRTLWVPQGSHYSFFTYNHPLADWSVFFDISKHDIGEQAIQDLLKPGEVLTRLMNKTYANSLLDMSSVKYVFVPLSETVNDDDVFYFQLKDREYFINELNKIPYLSRINIGTKNIAAYENENYRPHIYITNNQETISKEQEYNSIDYKFISPTEYTFSVRNVSKPFYLNFAESYHPQWDLRIGSFNWVDVLTRSNYFIDNKNHLKNDAGLNSYLLDPTVVCNVHKVNNVYKVGDGCVRNADGSYDISGTLYFAPQSYVYSGLVISGGTLIIVIGYLLFVFGRNVYERKN